jgi:hypothetical protein
MRDSVTSRLLTFSRQQSQRMTRSTSPSWKDFQPVPLQSGQV